MAHPDLSVEREWVGNWWLPGDDEHTVPGILRYVPTSGLRLDLVGGFDTESRKSIGHNAWTIGVGRTHWDMFHGVAENQLFTLRDCHMATAKTYNLLSLPSSMTVRPTVALIGIHQSEEDVFGAVAVAIENPASWVGGSKMRQTIDFKKGSRLFAAPRESDTCDLDDMTVSVHRSTSTPTLRRSRRDDTVAIHEAATVSVEFESPRSLDDVLDIVSSARDMVSLAWFAPSAPIWVRLDAVVDDATLAYPTRTNSTSVELYYRAPVEAQPDEDRPKDRPLFFLEDVAFDEFIRRWFRSEWLPVPRRMLLGALYEPRGYLEPQVITVVSAAESLHRRLSDLTAMPAAEFQEVRAALLEAVPKSRKDWLRNLLTRNEPSLPQRLVDLVGRLDERVINQVVPDPRAWARRAANARNALAHDGSTEDQTPEQLYQLTLVSRTVVALVVLNELGLSPDAQLKLLNERQDFAHAASIGRELFPERS